MQGRERDGGEGGYGDEILTKRRVLWKSAACERGQASSRQRIRRDGGGRGVLTRPGGGGVRVRRGSRGRRGGGSVETGCLLGPEGRAGRGAIEEEGREMRFSRHSRRD